MAKGIVRDVYKGVCISWTLVSSVRAPSLSHWPLHMYILYTERASFDAEPLTKLDLLIYLLFLRANIASLDVELVLVGWQELKDQITVDDNHQDSSEKVELNWF